MLTLEMLSQNEALAGLTDDQRAAIAEMSKNDENTVIGTRIGELHGRYDTDIFGITNVKKKDGEKSYEYAKRVLNDFKAKAASADSIRAELDSAKGQIADLQAKLEKSASDETLGQQLKDARASVEQLRTQLRTKETEFEAEKSRLKAAITDAHVDYAFRSAVAGIKFKAGIPDAVQKVLLDAAKSEVLAKGTPDLVDDEKGGRMLVLRGSDGNILTNTKTGLKPYTMAELVMETSLKDAIDTGRQQSGGGTRETRSSGGTLLDLSGARTQVEADRVIERYLLDTGLTRDSKEFAEQSIQLRNENNVTDLPIR